MNKWKNVYATIGLVFTYTLAFKLGRRYERGLDITWGKF